MHRCRSHHQQPQHNNHNKLGTTSQQRPWVGMLTHDAVSNNAATTQEPAITPFVYTHLHAQAAAAGAPLASMPCIVPQRAPLRGQPASRERPWRREWRAGGRRKRDRVMARQVSVFHWTPPGRSWDGCCGPQLAGVQHGRVDKQTAARYGNSKGRLTRPFSRN